MKTLILSGYGLNCEKETLYACEKSGAEQVDVVHLSDIMSGKTKLEDYGFIIFIGGFLDGDNLGSARIGANRIKYSQLKLGDALIKHIEQKRLVLGICNGFQLLVKMGALPALNNASDHKHHQSVSLTTNISSKFEDRWVDLKVNQNSNCVFTKGMDKIFLPIRHGEGRICAENEAVLQQIEENNLVPLYYSDKNNQSTMNYPQNPNGSPNGIAALSNQTGNVMGMMPHPEAYNHYTNHPYWHRLKFESEDGEGLKLIKNAYHYLK